MTSRRKFMQTSAVLGLGAPLLPGAAQVTLLAAAPRASWKHWGWTNPNPKDYRILKTARLLLPSGENLAEDEQSWLQTMTKKGVSPRVPAQSVRVGKLTAAAVVSFSKTDKYST